MLNAYKSTSLERDNTQCNAHSAAPSKFLRAGRSGQGCWPFHACAICAPPA
jgi:hypothetical protein